MRRILVSWIGHADLRAPEEFETIGVGPVAQALIARSYDEFVLLTDHEGEAAVHYVPRLEACVAHCSVRVLREHLTGPTEFAYLQLVRFDRLPDGLSVTCRPILFAGLLGHWGHKGPAEIEAKRLHTYRYSQWRADREGVPLRYPPVHPFNPLRALRLCIARGSDAATVRAVFDHIWRDGIGIDSEAGWRALAERLDIDDADALVSAPEVKDELRRSTEEAIAAGVYGVPTFRVGRELFWGDDATGMMLDYLADPDLFETGELKRVSHLPAGTQRKAVENRSA